MKLVRKFAAELFRRKVVRLLGAYVAIFWLLATGVTSLFPALGFPAWASAAFIIVGIAAIPVLAFFSWKYDLVPPQLVRDPKDAQPANPALGWALLRHDSHSAGYVLLKWSTDDGTGREERFFKPVAIGREPGNDVELADQRVSRHHAVIWAEAGAWRVRDLESANGTFVDGTRIRGVAALPQVCELRFHAQGPAVAVCVTRTVETVISP